MLEMPWAKTSAWMPTAHVRSQIDRSRANSRTSSVAACDNHVDAPRSGTQAHMRASMNDLGAGSSAGVETNKQEAKAPLPNQSSVNAVMLQRAHSPNTTCASNSRALKSARHAGTNLVLNMQRWPLASMLVTEPSHLEQRSARNNRTIHEWKALVRTMRLNANTRPRKHNKYEEYDIEDDRVT